MAKQAKENPTRDIERASTSEGTTVSPSETSSVGEDDDYYTKFNTLAGWQSILLMQFQIQMKVAILCSIYFSFIYCMVELGFAYGNKEEAYFVYNPARVALNGILYTGDVIYVIDCFSMLIFKRVKWNEIRYRYKPRSKIIIAIEMLSWIPLELFYSAIVKPTAKVYTSLRLRYLLRLVRLHSYITEAKDYVGTNTYLLHLGVYVGIISLAITCSATVSYIIKCHDMDSACTVPNYNLFAESVYLSSALWTFVGSTSYQKDWILDNVFLSFLGFLMTSFFTGYFVCSILRRIKAKCYFLNMCTWRKNTIATWKKKYVKDWSSYHKKYEALMEDYSVLLWERTHGNYGSVYLGSFLPAIMYKEIYLDISWVPLKHSHLFRNEDVFFLRLISQILQQRFFCPGEIIYKRDQYKTSMVYIVSGTADILSEEDGETAIMSLSSGTCLGESSLVVSYPSTSTVISKDMCDAVILDRRDFARVGMLYPDKMKRIISVILARYTKAKQFQVLSEYQFRGAQFEERVGVLTMKWLKHTLRSLLFNVRKVGDLFNRHYLKKLEQNVFCTKFLDLLAQAEDEDVVTDAVFIRTGFPFVFRPKSVLTKFWNAVILVLVAYLLITYPWFMVYYTDTNPFFEVSFGFVTVCWLVDIYLRSSIAIKTKYRNYNTVSDILVYNFSSFTFFLDIFAAIPWELIIYLMEGELTYKNRMGASINRLIKVYKLEQLFTTVKVKTQTLVYLTLIKFCTYLVILLYYSTAVCFLLGRSSENYEQFMEYTTKFNPELDNILQQVYMSMFGVIQFRSDMDVAGFPFTNGYVSSLVLILLQYSLVVLNLCFVAYLSAIVTMNMLDEHRKEEYNRNMAVTMECFNLHSNLQERVWRYIDLQYKSSGIYFLISTQIFDQIPKELVIMSRSIYLGELLKTHELFFSLDDAIVHQIAYIATVHLVPEKEVIKQIGEMCPEIYILRDGVCRMEDWRNNFKIVEHSEAFNALEACLDVKSLVTVRTETPCLLVAISIEKFKAILLRYKVEYDQLERAITTYEYRDKLALYSHVAAKLDTYEKVKGRQYRFFGFFLKKRTKKYSNFQEGFSRRTWIFRYLLLRIVFSNNGYFVFYWELIRALFAFATAIMIPTVQFYGHGSHTYILLALDITAYLDIYMRHHFSYYNGRGIEIMHPMKTAIYYWKHAFFLDLFASVPHEAIFSTVLDENAVALDYIKYIRYLQLYRFRHFLNFIFENKVQIQALVVLKYVPYVAIIINMLSAIFLKCLCTVNPFVLCHEESSIYSKITDNTTLYDIYGLGIYITTISLTYSNHLLIKIGTNTEVIFITIAGFLGMIGIYFYLAKVIEVNLSINRDLSAYQEAMQRLNQFLSYRKIDKHLKTELINHFEYRWKRTKGKSIHRAFQHFKRSFKVEALYNIYGIGFKNSTIFPSPNEGFFRSLLLEVSHKMYLKRAFIYRVNDVDDGIYLLLKGIVAVVGADGNKLTSLPVGSVFGNLDNCPLGRRTLSIVASSHVEVLQFSSTVFHRHLANFSHLNNHFKRITRFDVDFLKETSQVVNKAVESAVSSVFKKKYLLADEAKPEKGFFKTKIFNRNRLIKIWEDVIICYISYFSYFVELYHLTTLADSYLIYSFLYIIDLLFLIKIYLMFHTAYEDEYGKTIKTRSAIARRYIKMKRGFFLDVCTTLPFDALMYIFREYSNRRYLYPILRLNRFPRVVNGIIQLRSLTQKLNVIVIVVRMWYLIAWILLVTFTLGSTLLFFDYEYFPSMSRRMKRFLTSTQFVINSCISTSKAMPADQEMPFHWTLWVSVLMLLSKGIYIVFITECCSILVVVNHTRNCYEQFMIFIKAYLQNENVSTPLAEKVIDYTNLLWAYHKGVQFPSLLTEAPYYLREAVLNSMFGFHLDNHPVLKDLHKDLARQMTARMKTLIFFPGDKVAYVGDIDRCMYFIDEGEIVALSEDTMYSEVVEEVLHMGQMFGLQQGIHYNMGHSYTYKVTMYTVLVVLKRDDWIHLLDFYPASKHILTEVFGTKLDRA